MTDNSLKTKGSYKHYDSFYRIAYDFYKFSSWGEKLAKDPPPCYKDDYFLEVGAGCSQLNGEFFETWEIITQYIKDNNLKKITFLEIGAFNGLWGLMLSHIGEELNIPYEYTAIDFAPELISTPEKTSLFKLKKYYQNRKQINTIIASDSRDITNLDKLNKEYNIVFIDGDHSYEGAASDIKLYSNLATDILLFHDILWRDRVSNIDNVRKAINDSKIKLDEEISYKIGGMGIGIKYIKNA
tara:strand:+ start:138 stop:860 length:723 start_codon:yes stop_codon:yes gene_type:complete